MFNENHKVKMHNFIKKIISSPCYINDTPLFIEQNIKLFFIQNKEYLKHVLLSEYFFPDLKWSEVQTLFYSALTAIIDSKITPLITYLLQKKINFQFLNILFNREITLETFRGETFKIINKFLKNSETRIKIDNLIRILDNNLIEKYLNAVYDKKGYIEKEFTMNEKIKLSQDLLSSFIKFVLILSLIGFIKDDLYNASLTQKNNEEHMNNYNMQKNKYEKILKQYFGKLNVISENLLNKGISFHMNFHENKTIPASSRFAKIFFLLAQDYTPQIKNDKGAEPYEKSWFQSQQKNYKYFGLDLEMINELYEISSKNNW